MKLKFWTINMVVVAAILLFPQATYATQQTINFQTPAITGQDRNLTGQYPTGVINWGNTHWYLSGPWNLFTTKSVSFRKQSQTTGTFTFVNPRRVISLKAYNGGSVASTISLSCGGNPTVQVIAPVGQITTVNTNWANLCTSSVTFGSTNGWNTNFDDIVIDDAPNAPDTQAPTVSITAPANEATVSATLNVTASATDNIGVAGVQFKLDGNNLGAEDTTAPYTTSWDSKTTTNGPHTLTAVARDEANNSTTSTAVNVNVDNPSTIIFNQPTEGQSIVGTSITINYDHTGETLLGDHAHFYLDDDPVRMADYDYDGTYVINDVSPGPHTLIGKVAHSDHEEVVGSDDTVNFTTTMPDTTLPTVLITAPFEDATVSGTINVTANASDNVAVAGVQFKVDGVNLGAEDTTAPYSASWNTTTADNGSHSLTAVARDTSLNMQTSSPVAVNVSNTDPRAQTGEWGSLMNWPLVAVHTSLMSTGKVLMWDAWEYGTTFAKVWDPATNTFVEENVSSQLFCAGHSTMADGKIITTGGHNGGEVGIRDSRIFDPLTSSWSNAANMNTARWYPSNVTLGDGRVLTISGQITGGSYADTPEIYNPATNTWTNVPVSTASMHDTEYPLAFLQPNGKIYVIGATPGVSNTLDLTNNTWTNAGPIPTRLGSAAMIRPGKILYTGGGDVKDSGAAAKTQASILDLNQPTPTWTTVAPMHFPRYEHNLTVLPDGKVMAIAGANIISQTTGQGTLTPELYDPDSNTWTDLANHAVTRGYHSTSVLLPDGRVLSAGGGRLGGAPDRFNGQLFSPPYLFKGPRPTITLAPSVTSYGQQMVIETPDAQSITKVSFIPLASNTHTLDMNQKYVELSFTQNQTKIDAIAPIDPNIAPPGYYMIFVLNGNGVPSVAKIVKLEITPDTQGPTVSVTAPAEGATVANTINITADATDNIGVASVQFKVDGNNFGAPDNTAPFAINWDSKTVANGQHIITADAIDPSSNSTTSSPIAINVDNPLDLTGPVISGVQATNITTTTATINWVTDEPSSSLVEYGLDTNYGEIPVLNPAMVTPHSISLTGLAVNTIYHYRVKSTDPSGNQSISNDFTFSTLASNPITITFDDKSGQDQPLTGQYPTNVITWTSGQWFHSGPWNLFTTKSASFNGASQTTGTFNFVTPKKIVSVRAYNGGTVTSTLSFSCTGNPTAQVSVPVNQIVTLTTNWTNNCTSAVTVGSTNGWNTNIDDLVIE